MNNPVSNPSDKVLVLKNADGDHFAIPLDKLDDSKLREEPGQPAGLTEQEIPGFEIVGVVQMTQEDRKAAYMRPTVSSNFEIDMPTS